VPPWEGEGGGGVEGNVWRRCFQEGGLGSSECGTKEGRRRRREEKEDVLCFEFQFCS